MDFIKNILKTVSDFLNFHLFELGVSSITIGSILYFVFSLVVLIIAAEWIRRWLSRRLFPKYRIDIGVNQAISTMVKYVILIIGFIVIIHSVGIDMSALGLIAGAVGVGIGFGLQNITNNFVSGIIILFERPIKIGDRIEVGNVNGDVISIAARATTVITNDNIAIIVPNSAFISSQVINWSHTDRKTRFKFPVSVSYNEDPEKVREVLMKVALENENILKTPPPDVLFDAYGNSSLDFILRVWTTEYVHRPNVLKSQLYFEIFKKFKDLGIEIPYPQRDLHLKSGFEVLKT